MENGDVQSWCHWCGMCETLNAGHFMGMKIMADKNVPRNTIILTGIGVPNG